MSQVLAHRPLTPPLAWFPVAHWPALGFLPLIKCVVVGLFNIPVPQNGDSDNPERYCISVNRVEEGPGSCLAGSPSTNAAQCSQKRDAPPFEAIQLPSFRRLRKRPPSMELT